MHHPRIRDIPSTPDPLNHAVEHAEGDELAADADAVDDVMASADTSRMGKRRKGPRFRGFGVAGSSQTEAQGTPTVVAEQATRSAPLQNRTLGDNDPPLEGSAPDALDAFAMWIRAREDDRSWWQEHRAKMLAYALDSASQLSFSAREYHDAVAFVGREHDRFTAERRGAIDSQRRWTRLQYHCLRNEYRWHKDSGRSIYSRSDHWQEIRRRQLGDYDRCDRCRSSEYLEVHHLHYATVGVERPGIDLVTLCFRCHQSEDGLSPTLDPPYGPLTAASGFRVDDEIPF